MSRFAWLRFVRQYGNIGRVDNVCDEGVLFEVVRFL